MKMKKSLIAVLLGSLCLLSACDKPTQSAQSTTAQAAPAESQVDYKQLALNKAGEAREQAKIAQQQADAANAAVRAAAQLREIGRAHV